MFWKIVQSIFRLLLSKINTQRSYLKIYQRLIHLYPIKHKRLEIDPKIAFPLNISILLKTDWQIF